MSILSVGAVGDFKTSTNLSLQIRSDLIDYYNLPPKSSTCDRLLWKKNYENNTLLNKSYQKYFS